MIIKYIFLGGDFLSVKDYYTSQYELKLTVKTLKEAMQKIKNIIKEYKTNTIKDIEFSVSFKYL